MRAGHDARNARDAVPAQEYAGDAQSHAFASSASLARPALNSTAHLQRQVQALAAEVFEEDDEAMAEYERRTKQAEIKVQKVLCSIFMV